MSVDFRADYLAWAETRLHAIIYWLESLDPPPDIVVFPEGATPFEHLYLPRDFSQRTSSTVVAGTHHFQKSDTARNAYSQIGLSKRQYDTLHKTHIANKTLLPIFDNGRGYFRLKHTPSVFEQSDIGGLDRHTNSSATPTEPLRITVRNNHIRILPLVCSEAIASPLSSSDYDLLIVPSWNPKGISHFQPIVNQHSQRGVPVVYVNEGAFGDSGIFAPVDHRRANWWSTANDTNGRLPKGDALLLLDLDMNNLAPSVGVTNPAQSTTLVSLSSIVPENGIRQAVEASQEISAIGKDTSASGQQQRITDLLNMSRLHPLQYIKLKKMKSLCETHSFTEPWPSVLCGECIVPHIKSLGGLEAEFGQRLSETARTLLTDANLPDDAYPPLGKLSRAFRAEQTAQSKVSSIAHADQLLDRDQDTKDLREFLSSSAEHLAVISGLEQTGKSLVIAVALRQTGIDYSAFVSLTNDSTLLFIARSLLRSCPSATPSADEITNLESAVDALSKYLPPKTIIWIENLDQLRSRGAWREPEAPNFLCRLADTVREAGGKLILESRFQVDLPHASAGVIKRKKIRGLPLDAAVEALNQHLRRHDLSPQSYGYDDRWRVAKGLGCHPGALILVSELVRMRGFNRVVDDVQKRVRTHADIVRQLIKNIPLSEKEQKVLSLLSLAREAVPMELLARVMPEEGTEALRGLIDKALIDRVHDDRVLVSPLVRGFADLPSVDGSLAASFHEACARFFESATKSGKGAPQLRANIEANYHAKLAGNIDINVDASGLHDSTIAALYRLIRDERFEEAKPIAEELLRSKDDAELYDRAALIRARLGEIDEAFALAKEAFSRDKERLWILTEVGRKALHVRRNDITKNIIELVRAHARDDSHIAVLEGQVAWREGDTDGAKEAFKRAIEVVEGQQRGRSGWPHYYYARALLREGDLDGAIEVAHRGEVIESRKGGRKRIPLVLLRAQLGYAYLFKDDLDNATRWFEILKKADSGHPETRRVEAFLRIAENNPEEAREALGSIDPNKTKNRQEKATAYLYRAQFFRHSNLLEKSSTEFSRAHEADPGNVFALVMWAWTLVELARRHKSDREHERVHEIEYQAKDVAEKVLEIDSESVEARRILEALSDEFQVI